MVCQDLECHVPLLAWICDVDDGQRDVADSKTESSYEADGAIRVHLHVMQGHGHLLCLPILRLPRFNVWIPNAAVWFGIRLSAGTIAHSNAGNSYIL